MNEGEIQQQQQKSDFVLLLIFRFKLEKTMVHGTFFVVVVFFLHRSFDQLKVESMIFL